MYHRFSLQAAAILCLGSSLLGAPEIVAHRGASFDAPENTIASLRLGWKQQADACELDVVLSKDGHVVVNHDATTKRNMGVDRKVVEQTLEELQQLDAGAWKGEQWRGEKLPTLVEALATIPDGRRLFIEIKSGPEILPVLVPLLESCGKKSEQLVIIAFDHSTIKQAKALLPDLKMYWLASPEKDSKGLIPKVEDLIAQAREAKVDGLDVSSKFSLDAPFVSKVKATGMELHVWTVNDAVLGKRLAALGVDGITTDRPGWLREQLASLQAAHKTGE